MSSSHSILPVVFIWVHLKTLDATEGIMDKALTSVDNVMRDSVCYPMLKMCGLERPRTLITMLFLTSSVRGLWLISSRRSKNHAPKTQAAHESEECLKSCTFIKSAKSCSLDPGSRVRGILPWLRRRGRVIRPGLWLGVRRCSQLRRRLLYSPLHFSSRGACSRSRICWVCGLDDIHYAAAQLVKLV